MEEKQEMSFETAIARLEEIVRMLESGNAPLDKALAAFESLLKFPIIGIAVPKLRKPMLHILPCQLRLLQLCRRHAERQFFFLFFQLFKPLFC